MSITPKIGGVPEVLAGASAKEVVPAFINASESAVASPVRLLAVVDLTGWNEGQLDVRSMAV